MKIGLVSDSHGDVLGLLDAAAACQRMGCEAFLHMGDGAPSFVMRNFGFERQCAVCGNCDGVPTALMPPERVLMFGDTRVLMSHGHHHAVKMGLTNLSRRAAELGASVALYGHTHAARQLYVNGVLCANPGALAMGSFAVLELRDGDMSVTFHTL